MKLVWTSHRGSLGDISGSSSFNATFNELVLARNMVTSDKSSMSIMSLTPNTKTARRALSSFINPYIFDFSFTHTGNDNMMKLY